jgi:hypothetical protein
MTPEAGRAPGIQPAAFALEGCCPVTLLEKNQWSAGDRRYGVVHRQCTYLFAGPAEQQRFYQDPDRYSPALSGMDPVKFVESRQLVPGKRSHGVVFEDRIYLFQDEPSLQRFADSPQRYIAIVAQAQGEGSQ